MFRKYFTLGGFMGGGHKCIFCQVGLHDKCNNKSGAKLDIQGHCPCLKCYSEMSKPFSKEESKELLRVLNKMSSSKSIKVTCAEQRPPIDQNVQQPLKKQEVVTEQTTKEQRVPERQYLPKEKLTRKEQPGKKPFFVEWPILDRLPEKQQAVFGQIKNTYRL